MIIRPLAGLLLLSIAVSINAADFNQTFNDAKTWGSQQQTSIPSQINTGTAQTKVPNYQSSSSATNNYGNGNTSLFGLGSTKVSDCSTNPTDPQYTSQECNAVNTIAKSPMQRPKFTITKNDPILQAVSSIINNPSALAGSINGTYSACTTKTTTTPDTYSTETCDIYHPVSQQTCNKIDNVTVTTQSVNCTPGTQLAQTSGTYKFMFTWNITTTIYCAASPTEYTVNKYACTNGACCGVTATLPADGVSRPMGSCSASSGSTNMTWSPYSYSTCSGNSCTEKTASSLTTSLPPTPYTAGSTTTVVQDNWVDQCTSFEAAAQ